MLLRAHRIDQFNQRRDLLDHVQTLPVWTHESTRAAGVAMLKRWELRTAKRAAETTYGDDDVSGRTKQVEERKRARFEAQLDASFDADADEAIENDVVSNADGGVNTVDDTVESGDGAVVNDIVRKTLRKEQRFATMMHGEPLSSDERRAVIDRVKTALTTPVGQWHLRLHKAVMDAGDDASARRTARRTFMEHTYDDMTSTEIEQFRNAREQYESTLYTFTDAAYRVAQQERREAANLEKRALNAMAQQLQQLQIDDRNSAKIDAARDLAGGNAMFVPPTFQNMSPFRRQVASTVVKPEFHTTRDLSMILSDLSPSPLFVAAAPPSTTKTTLSHHHRGGARFDRRRPFFTDEPAALHVTQVFPPSNANPTIVYPFTATFTPPTTPLPEYMNWADMDNVERVRAWDLSSSTTTTTVGFVHDVVDQRGCGSCWVISVASAMSDRVAIQSQTPNPQLSVTNILGCVSDHDPEHNNGRPIVPGASMYAPATAGCAGGLPMGAIEMLSRFGDTDDACIGYEWCEHDAVCSTTKVQGVSDTPAYLNSIIPACAPMLGSCVSPQQKCKQEECVEEGDEPMRRDVWGLRPYPSSGRPYICLTDIVSIQQEIAAHGPVVATHALYADFHAGTAAVVGDGWSNTRGVYCNVQHPSVPVSERPYNGTRYAGSETHLVGYHAVVIVGWGVERGVPDWRHNNVDGSGGGGGGGGEGIDIPYWIVRNSWGAQWNPGCTVNEGQFAMPGYAKIAMTNRARHLNTKVYLDNADDGLVGAAVAFTPDVPTRTPPRSLRYPTPLVDASPGMEEHPLVSNAELNASKKVFRFGSGMGGGANHNNPPNPNPVIMCGGRGSGATQETSVWRDAVHCTTTTAQRVSTTPSTESSLHRSDVALGLGLGLGGIFAVVLAVVVGVALKSKQRRLHI